MKKWACLFLLLVGIFVVLAANADDEAVPMKGALVKLADHSASEWFSDEILRAAFTLLAFTDFASETGLTDLSEVIINTTYVLRDGNIVITMGYDQENIYAIALDARADEMMYSMFSRKKFPGVGGDFAMDAIIENMDMAYKKNSLSALTTVLEAFASAL